MKARFADTFFYIAAIDDSDAYHEPVKQFIDTRANCKTSAKEWGLAVHSPPGGEILISKSTFVASVG